MLKIITFLLFLFVALISGKFCNITILRITDSLLLFSNIAADVDYIMALKSPVSDKTYKDARTDVESAGGKVTYEFRAAFKAVLVSLPSEHVSTLSTKPYVEFMEEDKSGLWINIQIYE